MKIQTSLEFLILASAIGLLIFGSVTQYAKELSASNSIVNASHFNYSAPAGTALHQNPKVTFLLPVNSTAYEQNMAQFAAYGCDNGTINVSLNSSGIIFNSPSIGSAFYGAGSWQDPFYAQPGLNVVHVAYGIHCSGFWYNGSEDLYTISSGTASQAQYSAFLSNRNESAVYALSNQSIFSVRQFSHCTYLSSFNDQPYDMQDQCGGSSWGYMVESPQCYQRGSLTSTICIAPSSTGYNLLTPSQYPANYSYSVNLSIIDGSTLNSYLSSQKRRAPLLLQGKQVGNSTITNASGIESQPQGASISGNGPVEYVNSTYLGGYMQALNNLESTLRYYNGTEVPYDVESGLNQTVSSYQNAQSALVSSATQHTQMQCSVNGADLICPSTSPLYYLINVTVSPRYISGNQTISYAGSVIKVYG